MKNFILDYDETIETIANFLQEKRGYSASLMYFKPDAIELYNRLVKINQYMNEVERDGRVTEARRPGSNGSEAHQDNLEAIDLLQDRIRRAIDCLDEAVGDTSPDEIDYYEHPEVHAMHILLGVEEAEK